MILSLTLLNKSSDDKAPQDLLNVKALQGQSVLQKKLSGQNGYDPSKWVSKVSPGSATTFQIAYVLKDDQPFHVTFTDKDTGEKLAEKTESVS